MYRKIRLCLLLISVFTLTACGGSGNGSSNDSDVGLSSGDKYQSDYYQRMDFDADNLSGTWLFLAKKDVELDSRRDEYDRYRDIRSIRTIVSIIEVSPNEYHAYAEWDAYGEDDLKQIRVSSNGTIKIPFNRDQFDGIIDAENSIIRGEFVSSENPFYDDYNLVYHSSSVEMIKISDELSLNLSESGATWGNIAFTSESIDTPQLGFNYSESVHMFYEENLTWQAYKSGFLVAEDVAYAAIASALPPDNLSEFILEENRNLSFLAKVNYAEDFKTEVYDDVENAYINVTWNEYTPQDSGFNHLYTDFSASGLNVDNFFMLIDVTSQPYYLNVSGQATGLISSYESFVESYVDSYDYGLPLYNLEDYFGGDDFSYETFIDLRLPTK